MPGSCRACHLVVNGLNCGQQPAQPCPFVAWLHRCRPRHTARNRIMKRMLINATQPEERRLAIVDGQKLLDYEIEIEGREHRHGFLPFKEIARSYFSPGAAPGQARINEVIKEGQELLVQIEKEERGNKGAALTTFVSLAGRYVVLMPNNPRGGGVSRRIEGEDRAELKEAMDQLEYPGGMSIIARTAGIGRSAPELQWDLNYLLKLWNAIDGAAQSGKGAFLIYQESSLVIRAIRDYFNNDIGDILIDTDDIYEQAQQFMAHVMPEHAARVKRYRDAAALFSRFQIEHQIESPYARTVQLPPGGAIVIDHTEALVSVDVNSARAIKGGDIEETATRTNLEAADEVPRQMRLRDLGALIVIDFIDMEESKNRREVENRLRDALRQDRARVQFGTISKFGLMEMSRQRLKPALSEGASIPCPRCGGSGHIRDTESSALQILRIIQEESLKDNTASVLCQVPVEVASFLLNEKRTEIAKIELRQRISVLMVPNKTLETPNYKLERLKHDDPRLDHIESSYKLAEEVQDPTAVTRRSQEPTNKQTPVIKGVLPDAPAPAPIPAPAPAAQSPPESAPSPPPGAQRPAPPAPPPHPPPAPAPQPRPESAALPPPGGQRPAAPAPVAGAAQEPGFLPWLKSVLGFGTAPAPTPAAATTGRSEPRRDGRSAEGRGRRGERTPRDAEGRPSRDAEGRTPRDADNRAARNTNTARDAEGAGREGRAVREGRNARDGGRGRRSAVPDGAPRQQTADASSDGSAAPVEGLNGQHIGNGAPAQPQRGPRHERSERAERGERVEGRAERSAAAPEGAGAGRFPHTLPLAALDLSSSPVTLHGNDVDGTEGGAPGSEDPQRRERRSRDRYGRYRRDRRDRHEPGPRDAATDAEADAPAPMDADPAAAPAQDESPRRSYF